MGTTLCVPEEELTPKATLAEDIGADSLDIVELTMVIEEQLLGDEPIESEIADKWITVQDVIDSVGELMEAKEARRKKRVK